jgi:hypothetical protein
MTIAQCVANRDEDVMGRFGRLCCIAVAGAKPSPIERSIGELTKFLQECTATGPIETLLKVQYAAAVTELTACRQQYPHVRVTALDVRGRAFNDASKKLLDELMVKMPRPPSTQDVNKAFKEHKLTATSVVQIYERIVTGVNSTHAENSAKIVRLKNGIKLILENAYKS